MLFRSIQVLHARWRLFGHTLRMHKETPARMAMSYYFIKDQPGRKGNRITIATALSNEYKAMSGKSISTNAQYESVVEIAQDRDAWKEIVQAIVKKHSELQSDKIIRKQKRRLEKLDSSQKIVTNKRRRT